MTEKILNKANLTDVFATLKIKRKISGQEFKDMVRDSWERKSYNYKN